MSSVIVVGAGLGGCMVSLLLAKRGVRVTLLEGRPDWRVKEQKTNTGAFGLLTDTRARSINLALSYRGICALKRAGVFGLIQPSLIPMVGRAVHSTNGSVSLQPYGVGDQAIYSVSRNNLNDELLKSLEACDNVEIVFGAKVKKVSPDGSLTAMINGKAQPFSADVIIGADGAFSSVRAAIRRHGRVNFSQTYVDHGYKELTIPPNDQGDFALSPAEALHIWPRQQFMLIALPNPDKTFTCTLFAPFKGPGGFDNVANEAQLMQYFKQHFPDVIPLMPNLSEEFFQNPTSALTTVRLNPWHHNGKLVVIGDAAHAVVPFYGQGMNSAFEDGLIFDEAMEKCDGDLSKAIIEFNRVRQPDGDAIADLSLQNYVEMRALTAKTWFVLKKKLEKVLYLISPSLWTPLYTMVSFTRTPYHQAIIRAKKQDRALGWTLSLLTAAALAGGAAFAFRRLRSRM